MIVTSKDQLLTNTREENGRFLLVSKVDGKKHEIPLLTGEGPKKGPLDHRIPGHLKNLECATCHAAWTFQDLGLHLVLLEAADYEPWLRLTQQGDPQVQQVSGQALRVGQDAEDLLNAVADRKHGVLTWIKRHW